MINVRIYNCKDRLTRTRLRIATLFYIEKLLPRKRRLCVRIFITKGLLEREKMSGSCLADDFAANKKHYEFTINIDDSLNLEDTLSILAHEMTHVKQYATGQLLYDSANPHISIWEGKRYDDNKTPYAKQPWEIDAVAQEVALLKQLKETGDWQTILA